MEYVRAILIIIITGAVGGGIAFLGNQLGRFIGRKKLSIFKLRPRYTSMLITILTGMVIASSTLGVAWIISEPIRIAFINPKEFETKKRTLEELLKRVSELQQADLVYKKQDFICSVVIKTDPEIENMKSALKGLVSKSNEAAIAESKRIAAKRNEEFVLPPDGKLVGYIPENLESIARELTRIKGNQVIFVRAYQNATLGEKFRIELGRPIPYQRIFRKGELIHSAFFNGKSDYYTIYGEVLKTIRVDVGSKAIIAGLFPNPEDRSIGEFDENRLKELVNEIKKKGKKVEIEFYSADDAYILGPLKLEFMIK